jgi:hypothetical protein
MACREVDPTDPDLAEQGVRLPAPVVPRPTRCRVTIELEIEGHPRAARARVEEMLDARPLQRLIEAQRGLMVTSALVTNVEEL